MTKEIQGTTLQLHKMINIVQIKDSLNPMNTGYKDISLRSLNHIQELTVGEIRGHRR